MRLVLPTLFLGTSVLCCGLPDIPAYDGKDEAAPAAATPPPAPPAMPITPTAIAFLQADGENCALHLRTSATQDRTLAVLRGVCPPDASLVVHPDGTRLLLVDRKGITALDVATGKPSRLPELAGVLAARWNPRGHVLALTTEPAPDPAGKAVTVDGEQLPVTATDAVSVDIGRVFADDGTGWVKQKALLGYGYEGMTAEGEFAAEVATWVGVAPGWNGGEAAEKGSELTSDTPGPGTWRQDGALAFQFEWLEGVIPHGPLAMKLPDGTWHALSGFATTAGAVTWEARADGLWVAEKGAHKALFDLQTGEPSWQTDAPAWLLPMGLTVASSTLAGAPPPPPHAGGPRGDRPPGERPTAAERRAEGRPGTTAAGSEAESQAKPERSTTGREGGRKARRPKREPG